MVWRGGGSVDFFNTISLFFPSFSSLFASETCGYTWFTLVHLNKLCLLLSYNWIYEPCTYKTAAGKCIQSIFCHCFSLAGSIAALLGRRQRYPLDKSLVHHSVTQRDKRQSKLTLTLTPTDNFGVAKLNSHARLRGKLKHLERSNNNHEVKTRSHPSFFIKNAHCQNCSVL